MNFGYTNSSRARALWGPRLGAARLGCALVALGVSWGSTSARAQALPEDCQPIAAWDELAASSGLDMNACGLELVADTGVSEVEDDRLVVYPGGFDDLGLGATLGLGASAPDAAFDLAGRDYRVRFRFIGRSGLTDAALFLGVRYALDEEAGAIDASTFGAIGFNMTFDGAGHDDLSDHLHDDVRGPCLARLGDDGRAESPYPGFELSTETEWKIVLDIEGDRIAGPVTLLAKLFPAGEEEPAQPFGVYVLEEGLGPLQPAAEERAVMIAALGGGSLEIIDASVCDIPGEERRVQELACNAGHGGGVHVEWSHPTGADLTAPLRVLLDGDEVAELDGDAVAYEFEDLELDEQHIISVVNFSGGAATCTVGTSHVSLHFLRGDCTADGTVDISDAVLPLDYLFTGGATPSCLEACNVDEGEALDITDAVRLLQHLFLGGPPPEAPFPGCGHGHEGIGCDVEHCPHG